MFGCRRRSRSPARQESGGGDGEPEGMGARWRIGMLGGLRVEQPDGGVTRLRPQKMAALLAYLAYHPRQSHLREGLIELLWPEQDLDAARHQLSVTLSRLRHLLEPPGVPDSSVLVADPSSVVLAPGAVSTDVAEFEAALREPAGEDAAAGSAARIGRLEEALALYRGPLLPGYYEEWVLQEQRRLADLHLQALRRLARELEAASDPERALDAARQAVNANPLREESHQELIRLLIATGQPSAAAEQFRELERLLKRELNAVPAAATRALLQARAGAGSAGRAEPAAAPDTRAPAPLPSHGVGRPPAPPSEPPAVELEPVGGAVPPASEFYQARETDSEFEAAIRRRDSIVLVKGARQVGKTSLLARGLQRARQAGMRVVLTDLERLNARSLESADTLLLTLAHVIAEQLDLDLDLAETWAAHCGPNLNFARFLRRAVLDEASPPLLWALDEVDRLFPCDYGSEVFGLFRSFHNERALDPAGPWSRLTLAIAYATEAHLFITDLNSSPFNVGTRLALEDFTVEQVADLNRHYASPLETPGEVRRFFALVGGHPYLVRRGLHDLATNAPGLDAFEARAARQEWIFGEHLRRLLSQLQRDPDLCAALRRVLDGEPCPTADSFYRLRSAGVLVGDIPAEAHLRCGLYAAFLARRLA